MSSVKGENGLRVKSSAAQFSLSPVILEKDGVKAVRFLDETYNYSNYGSISFSVRNNGSEDIVFDGLRFQVNAVTWYETADAPVVIPADGRWYEISTDINSLYLYGEESGITLSNNAIASLNDIDFMFEGENADLSFDEVEFGSEEENAELRIDFNILSRGGLAEIVKMFVLSLADYVKSLIGVNN